MMRSFVSFVALLIISTVQPVQADIVRVASASNFIKPLRQLAYLYESQSGHQIQLSFASSGKHTAQIVNGAPFDLFLSADAAKPKKLESLGLTVPASRFTYANGKLLLWSPQDNLNLQGAEALKDASFSHFAIANERLAPYGRAAKQALSHFSNPEQITSQLVIGENIVQTYRFVESGNAQFGLIALAQVADEGKIATGSGWIIPESWYQPIEQQAVLLKQAENNQAAQGFIQFLRSAAAKAIIRSYGYEVK